ncbi:MAG TPA: ion channel [Thermodesulfobacteriota bacterium]|nr:ion channel [Thermodesulfobacteriota bacterium]
MHNKLYKQIIYLITHPKRNKNKFLYFFVSIVVLLLFIPFLEGEKYTSALLHLLTTIILLTGIYAVSHTRKQIVIASVLGLPWLIANWVSLFVAMKTLGPGAISWGALFFIYTTTIMFSHVIKGSKVTIETLFGAVSVYLLIGLIYTSLYGLLEILSPGSFNLADSSGNIYPFKVTELIYFSYVTLTTLGYGDIIPVSSYARSLAISEAIIGQLYLTILVARLVGLHIIYSKS